MRWFSILTLGVALALPSTARAQSVSLGADFGYDRVIDHDTSGLGFNLYPGLSLGPLRAEAQLGYHRGVSDPILFGARELRTTYVPVMVGGRVGIPLGIVYPWVGAHGGFAYVGRTSEFGLQRSVSYTNREWEPAFNVGTGIDLCLGPAAIGGALWYNAVIDDDDPMRIVSAALSVRINL